MYPPRNRKERRKARKELLRRFRERAKWYEYKKRVKPNENENE